MTVPTPEDCDGGERHAALSWAILGVGSVIALFHGIVLVHAIIRIQLICLAGFALCCGRVDGTCACQCHDETGAVFSAGGRSRYPQWLRANPRTKVAGRMNCLTFERPREYAGR